MNERAHVYKLTIYVAAPGTPLVVEYENVPQPMKREDPPPTSTPGHMFYVVSRDKEKFSYGFAPIEHGSVYGAGHPVRNDLANYVDPYYERTLEITSEQYDRLKAFGEEPARHGFDMTYRDARNNCVDFTWAALHRAGIHPQKHGKDNVDFEGYLRPTHNIDAIRSIPDQLWGSPYNEHIERDLPKNQSLLQESLTEHGPIPLRPERDSSVGDLFERLYRASVAKDHITEREVGRAFAQTDAGRAMFAEASLMNDRQDLVEQQRALEAQRADVAQVVPQQRGRAMSM